MRKTKTKVRNENGEVTTEYFGGVERQQDIDVFSFYRAVKDTFPTLDVIIRKVLSNLAATATNERSFNIAGNILNLRRCRLDPKRAEKLILSAFRYKVNLAAGRKPPRLPSFYVIEKDDSYDDLEMEEALQDEEDAAGWEAFFDDEDNDVWSSFLNTFLYGNQVLDYVIIDYLIMIILKFTKTLDYLIMIILKLSKTLDYLIMIIL